MDVQQLMKTFDFIDSRLDRNHEQAFAKAEIMRERADKAIRNVDYTDLDDYDLDDPFDNLSREEYRVIFRKHKLAARSVVVEDFWLEVQRQQWIEDELCQ